MNFLHKKSFFLLWAVILLFFNKKLPAYPDSLLAVKYKKHSYYHLEKANIDSATYYYDLAINIYKENGDLLSWINLHRRNIYILSEKLDDPLKAIRVFDQFKNELPRQPANEKEWDSYGKQFIEIANIHKKHLENFSEAASLYETAINIFKKHTMEGEDPYVAHYAMLHVANIYTRLGDYDKAVYYLEKVIAIALENEKWTRAAKALNDLGLVYLSNGKHHNAETIFAKGLSIKKADPYSKNMLMANHAMNYMQLGEHTTALKLIQLAEKKNKFN